MYPYDICDRDIATDTDACYELVASQEEIYLEETEEQVRKILESDHPSPPPGESSNPQQECVAEEPIIRCFR